MRKFFEKLFGSSNEEDQSSLNLVGDVLHTLLEKAQLDLSFDLERTEEGILEIEVYGEDEELLTAKEGQLLDAIQLYLRRVAQHQIENEKVIVHVDCGGYRDQANQSLMELAEKLKNIAVSKGKPVYFRALPPRDRKVIHQYLAEDGKVKSRSVGDGLYKKIKIYPAKESEVEEQQNT